MHAYNVYCVYSLCAPPTSTNVLCWLSMILDSKWLKCAARSTKSVCLYSCAARRAKHQNLVMWKNNRTMQIMIMIIKKPLNHPMDRRMDGWMRCEEVRNKLVISHYTEPTLVCISWINILNVIPQPPLEWVKMLKNELFNFTFWLLLQRRLMHWWLMRNSEKKSYISCAFFPVFGIT